MNWPKISIWIINFVMIVSILAVVFGTIIAFNINEKTKGYITISSPKLKIVDDNKYTIDDDVQFKIRNDQLSGSKIKITHAQLLLANEDLSFNWMIFYGCFRVLLFLVALYLVREIIRTAENPFSQSNVKRLNLLGLLLIAGGIVNKVESWLGVWYIESNFEFTGMKLESTADLNWTMLISGLFVMVIARVFQNGIKIKKEQELTI